MKKFILVSLFVFASCSTSKVISSKKRGEPLMKKNDLKTLYIGTIQGDPSGEFRALLSKRLLKEGVVVGELPNRADGISKFFNNIKNPNIDVKSSAYLEGVVKFDKSIEICTSNRKIRCISTIGIANISIKRAIDNTLVMSDSFRIALNERQAFVDTQNQTLFDMEFDTRRILAFDVTDRVMGGQ